MLVSCLYDRTLEAIQNLAPAAEVSQADTLWCNTDTLLVVMLVTLLVTVVVIKISSVH